MIIKEKTWACVAANGPNIKAGDAHVWRCCFQNEAGENTSEEIPLTDCKIYGNSHSQNTIFNATSKGGTSMEGVIGWIAYYGNVRIDEHDVLHVTLGNPETK